MKSLESEFVDQIHGMAQMVATMSTARPPRSTLVAILATVLRHVDCAHKAVTLDGRGELTDAMLSHIVSLMASANRSLLNELPTARIQ